MNYTRSIAWMAERNQDRFASLQVMLNFRNTAVSMLQCFGHDSLPDYLELTPIANVMICPKEIVAPWNRDYILVAFDYEPARTGMEVIKTSDRYSTTHFREMISKN